MSDGPASEGSGSEATTTLFEAVGGEPFFRRLVDEFYSGVAGDDVLAPLYPEYPDLSGARHRLTLFLIQYWGGPTAYSDERGHPRLRMRHLPFPIGELQRDRWLHHMGVAVDRSTGELIGDPELRAVVRVRLEGYFRPSAEHLRNDTGLPITSPRFRDP